MVPGIGTHPNTSGKHQDSRASMYWVGGWTVVIKTWKRGLLTANPENTKLVYTFKEFKKF